ncbi:protein of unknown function DUF1271 [Parafrankia sp. EAN1pec]|uniref:ferredoxin n=1 Tax=Parafrankia TaxID=2994362 RepID=UPI0000543BC5|nr:ferredoxin [Parafrankia discariae]ABW12876.1 protein of unknown function DUF1271 [Frankia sp. EAN1pec]
MRVIADTNRCLGAGQCVLADPERFDQSDDGIVVVLRAEATDPAEQEEVRETVSHCPSRALSLAD